MSLQRARPKLCDRCKTLKLWSQDCSFTDTLSKLGRKSARCDLCQLLTHALKGRIVRSDETIKFYRVRSSLTFGERLWRPLLSLCTTSCNWPPLVVFTGAKSNNPLKRPIFYTPTAFLVAILASQNQGTQDTLEFFPNGSNSATPMLVFQLTAPLCPHAFFVLEGRRQTVFIW
jgi:hypothetical protein